MKHSLANNNPAESLAGIVFDDGWAVKSLVTKRAGATGGNFSKGYLVEHTDGRQGFLKALDYSFAHNHPEPSKVLHHMTSAYEFEKSMCKRVRELRMDRVVSAITYGSITVHATHPFRNVQYLIFERADGDIRACIDDANLFTTA